LNLTKSQVERLDTVFERDRPERIALRRKIAEMDRLLRRILLRANAEDVTVKRLSEQVEALRAQHNVRRTLMRFAIYRRLTAEQRSALAQLRRTDDDMRSGPLRDSDR
jgi:Spy/CpxP family protein refolding chaperone